MDEFDKMPIAEMVAVTVLAVFFILVAFSFFFGIVYLQAEFVFAKTFKRPFYVHFYPLRKKISPEIQFKLRQYSPFYAKLSDRHKAFFEHRIYRFLEKYEFSGRDDFEVTEDVKIRIASIYVMMSFGMRNYLTPIFERIVIYPKVYLSSIADQYHKGEFNPYMKAVVFSWEDFVAGNDISNDNLNLGIHEFGHILHHHGKMGNDVSAVIFMETYDRILEEIAHPPNRQKLLDSGYFREYAYTNQFEFLAVILENYFETPHEFKSNFPVLYSHVSKMLNHRH